MSDSKNRVAIYIRVSTLHQVDKDSLPMQRKDLVSYAKLILNTDDYEIFEDAGYSGKNMDRPKYQEMMRQVRRGQFTHILVWKIDRISRNLLDFATMYSELKDLGVAFISKNEQFDTSTAMGEAMLKIILVFAELERNMTSERVTATMISRASTGQWNGGRIPFGYLYDSATKEFSINEDEASVVRLIHDLYEKERSLVNVSRILNGKGLRSRAGTEWSPVTLRLILHSPFNVGDYRYNVLQGGNRQKPKDSSEWVTVEGHHPAIISREQKERVIAILENNARLNRERGLYSTHNRVHIFQGLVLCAECGCPMHPTSSNKDRKWQYSKYLCHTGRKSAEKCSAQSTSDPVIGEFVFNYILNMLNAQKNFKNIDSISDLESALLIGDTFNYISNIDTEGLEELYEMLESGVRGSIYGSSISSKYSSEESKSELSRLESEKGKLERAAERLTNLFLYSDSDMPESEYIIRKSRISDELENLNAQISSLKDESFDKSVPDSVFVKRASEFIISKNLAGRNYIYYKRLAKSVEPEILQSFVQGVIDSIVIRDGKVCQLVFRNGISHEFSYKAK